MFDEITTRIEMEGAWLMWRKELLAAIDKQQPVRIRLMDGEVHEGIPVACTDRVKLWREDGVIYIPLADIEHVSRLIQFHRCSNRPC